MDPASQRQPEEPPAEREPALNIPTVILALIAVIVGIELLRAFVLSGVQDIVLLFNFAFLPARYTITELAGWQRWVTPLTYSFLHGGWGHLAINMIWLAAFGSPLAARLGALRLAAFWVATALGAAGLHFLVYSDQTVPMVGASGVISGMMAAAARYGFRTGPHGRRRAFSGPLLPFGVMLRSRQVVVFLGVWFAVNLIAGFGWLTGPGGPDIAWQAHIGGFVTGFVVLPWLDPMARRLRN